MSTAERACPREPLPSIFTLGPFHRSTNHVFRAKKSPRTWIAVTCDAIARRSSHRSRFRCALVCLASDGSPLFLGSRTITRNATRRRELDERARARTTLTAFVHRNSERWTPRGDVRRSDFARAVIRVQGVGHGFRRRDVVLDLLSVLQGWRRVAVRTRASFRARR